MKFGKQPTSKKIIERGAPRIIKSRTNAICLNVFSINMGKTEGGCGGRSPPNH